MAKYLGSVGYPLKCFKCGHEFQEKIARLETDPEIPCPVCGVITHYNAEDLRRGMRTVDDGIDKLMDSLRQAVGKLSKP